MRSDDDTFLSSYLDGELDIDQQQRVESALAVSPELTERLRALAVVRDLVAGLHRGPGVDVAPRVMSQIQGRQRRLEKFASYRPWKARPDRVFWTASVLAAAAAVMLAVTLNVAWKPRMNRLADASARSSGRALDNLIADVSSSVNPGTAAETAAPALALQPREKMIKVAQVNSVSPNKAPDTQTTAIGSRDGQITSTNLERSRQMLDNPNERRIFLVKNGGDGDTQQHIASVIERTTRFGFYKITVSQGIVIDPRHPEEATVFALLVNPEEFGRLKDQLKVALQDRVEEQACEPRIVTQLAGITRVDALAPSPLGEVSISREALALRTRAGSAGTESAMTGAATASPDLAAHSAFDQSVREPAPGGLRVSSSAESPDAPSEALAPGDPLAAARLAPHSAAGHRPISRSAADGSGTARPRHEPADAGSSPHSERLMLVLVWVCKPPAG